MKSSRRIIFGIILIAIGVIAALSAAGVLDFSMLPAGITVGKLLLGAVLLFPLIYTLIHLHFTPCMMFLWLEAVVFEEYLGTLIGKTEANWFNNWIALLIALLIGAGLKLIFKGVRKKDRGHSIHIGSGSFGGDSLKYIDSANFKYQHFSNKFGDMEIRFENAELYRGGGTLNIDNSFGDITVRVPEDWDVVCDVDNSFGDINISKKFKAHYADGTGKTLRITGDNQFGDMDIKAI